MLNALVPEDNPLLNNPLLNNPLLNDAESRRGQQPEPLATAGVPADGHCEIKPTCSGCIESQGSGRLICRLGIITTRRVGNAVQRVRVRRLIRETFRAMESRLVPGVWIVVVARGGMVGAKLSDVQSEWLRLGNRLSIIAIPS